MKIARSILLMSACATLFSGNLCADTVRVAVAANFREAITEIAARFEAQSSHQVDLIFGSTGKHYAQIINGAPFDLFFAADAARPQRLEQEGHCVPGTRFTYAIGRLVLWSPDEGMVDPEGKILGSRTFRHLAIANPRLAPYGRAAEESLLKLGLWDAVSDRIVTGENIAQAYQFVSSGNADLGLVAWSQLHRGGPPTEGSWWLVPEIYAPIRQQAVLLKPGKAAESFIAFVKGGESAVIIRAHGYTVTHDS
jgi:molybdate transport system substrate-binding protein